MMEVTMKDSSIIILLTIRGLISGNMGRSMMVAGLIIR